MLEVSEGHLCRFYLSSDGTAWVEQGAPFHAVAGEWIGAKVGFYATRQIVQQTSPYKRADNDSGYLDVASFEMRIP